MMIIPLLGWLILYQVYAADEDVDDVDFRRPVWNIAHMVNAIYQADYYLDMGANSLEFDVSFDSDGIAQFTFHGVPCDCFRSCLRYEKIDDYLDYMRQLTTPGNPKFREQLVLLFLDVKVKGLSSSAKHRAGSSIARKLLHIYWNRGESDAKAYVLLSIPSVEHMEFVRGFREVLRKENFHHYEEKVGFDFSGNEDLDVIRRALDSVSLTDRIWQGDGITNCLPRGTRRLREAIQWRDQAVPTIVDKVYWWTVDKMSTMRATLRLGVDGMITNYPDRLVSVLEEEEFSRRFRMATIEDNPWNKHPLMMASLHAGDGVSMARGGNITIYKEDEEDELLYNC